MKMKFTPYHIPFKETGYFGKLITNYLEEAPDLKPFYSYSPAISSFANIMENRHMSAKERNSLVQTLKLQHTDTWVPEASLANMQALENETTFCCVTAHQLNICSGPLYVIYKTLTTIKLCKELSLEYPGYTFVPVFWLGSEDHDLEEINHVTLFHQTFTWNTTQTGAVGRMKPSGMLELLEEMKPVVGEREEAKKWIETLLQAYGNSENMAAATRNLLYAIFKEEGLLVVDGDDAAFKRIAIQIMEEELLYQKSSAIVQETSNRLSEHYDVQAHPREINLFYLAEGIRSRILKEDGQYKVLYTDISFSPSEIIAELHQHPERFSPNVILRPLFQQMALPSLAYVGGAGELAYWFQLGDLFEYAGLKLPALILRNSMLIVDKTQHAKLTKLHIELKHIFYDENRLIQDWLEKESGDHVDLTEERNQVSTMFGSLLKKAMAIDPSLESAMAAEKVSAEKVLDKVEQKMLKAEKHKHETSINQIKNIRQKLFPQGQLQERTDNLGTFVIKYGWDFLDVLSTNTNPFQFSFSVLVEEE